MSSSKDFTDEFSPRELESETTRRICVGATFASASDRVHAVQDYALDHNKSVKVEKKSGQHRLIVCRSDGCTMFVGLYRKQVNKSPGDWHVSSLSIKHKNCTAASKPTKRQIASLSTFASAVRADTSVSVAALVNQVRSRDGVSLQDSVWTIYRAK